MYRFQCKKMQNSTSSVRFHQDVFLHPSFQIYQKFRFDWFQNTGDHASRDPVTPMRHWGNQPQSNGWQMSFQHGRWSQVSTATTTLGGPEVWLFEEFLGAKKPLRQGLTHEFMIKNSFELVLLSCDLQFGSVSYVSSFSFYVCVLELTPQDCYLPKQ